MCPQLGVLALFRGGENRSKSGSSTALAQLSGYSVEPKLIELIGIAEDYLLSDFGWDA